jgi:hypothetical protein
MEEDKTKTPDTPKEVLPITELTIGSAIDDCINASRVWERTLLAKSNKALYSILERVFHMAHMATNSNEIGEALKTYCKDRGFKFKGAPSPELRLCKMVFGHKTKDRARAADYSKVLVKARDYMPKDTTLAVWIHSEGGVEAVRSTDYKAIAEGTKPELTAREQRIEDAKSTAKKVSFGKVPKSVTTPKRKGLCLILARVEDDDTTTLLHYILDDRLVDAALSIAGTAWEKMGTVTVQTEAMRTLNDLAANAAKQMAEEGVTQAA